MEVAAAAAFVHMLLCCHSSHSLDKLSRTDQCYLNMHRTWLSSMAAALVARASLFRVCWAA